MRERIPEEHRARLRASLSDPGEASLLDAVSDAGRYGMLGGGFQERAWDEHHDVFAVTLR